jgi:hypothetical protein
MTANDEAMTDEEIIAAKEELKELQKDVRVALAEEFGGKPDDYRGDVAVTDGGDS